MAAPKKGLADIALEVEPAEDEAAEEGGDLDALCGELFDAIKSDDQAGFATAMKAIKAL